MLATERDALFIRNQTLEMVPDEEGRAFLLPYCGRKISANKSLSVVLSLFSTPRRLADVRQQEITDDTLLQELTLNSLIAQVEDEGLHRGLLATGGRAESWVSLADKEDKLLLVGAPYSSDPHGHLNAALGCKDVLDLLDLSATSALVYLGEVLRFTDEGGPAFSARTKFLTREILRGGHTPFVLGGDHSITYSIARAGAECHPDLGVICFDAHADDGPAFSTKQRATPLSNANVMSHIRRFLPEGHVQTIGVRTGKETLENCSPDRIQARTEMALARLDGRPLHVSIDIDVLDPSFAPDVNYPCSGGMSPHQLTAMVGKILDEGMVISLDLVEVCPSRKSENVTAKTAAAFISWFSARRVKGSV